MFPRLEREIVASAGFPIPLPFDVTQHILSFIPPLWTEVTRESILPANGSFKMVLAESRYRYRDARFLLLNPGYGFQELKRGEINFATCEAGLFLSFRKRAVPVEITIGDIFPLDKTPQALGDLLKFNYQMSLVSKFESAFGRLD